MTQAAEIAHPERDIVFRAAALLGGSRTFPGGLKSALDVHTLILRGFRATALTEISKNVVLLQDDKIFEKALGLSIRTFQRAKKAPTETRLSQEQSGRVWRFAEIYEKALDVFGGPAAADEYLLTPAPGLEQNRPIDLLSTPAGAEIVSTHLERMKYGVYA